MGHQSHPPLLSIYLRPGGNKPMNSLYKVKETTKQNDYIALRLKF